MDELESSLLVDFKLGQRKNAAPFILLNLPDLEAGVVGSTGINLADHRYSQWLGHQSSYARQEEWSTKLHYYY